MQHVFIHPWLNREERWGALFVSTSAVTPECCASLIHLCGKESAVSLGQSLPWFVPLSPGACTTHSEGWPIDRTVFLVQEPEDSDKNSEWLKPAERVRADGGKVGVLAFAHRPLPPPGGKWDYVILEAAHARTAPPVKMMVLETRSAIALTAVKTRQDLEWALANNAALVSTEFLLTRAREPMKPDMRRLHLLQLLSLVTQDADTRELEEIFRQEPKLSYSLLRLVNSAAMGLRTPVTSYAQAISLLGRRQLQRWLQLLVYADPDNIDGPNPLLQWAAMRGRLMELAFQQIKPPPELAIEPDSAFMTGIFSLLDVLLNLSMDDILAQLPVATPVKLALTERAGPLGELLRAVESGERKKYAAASETLTGLGIGCAEFAQAQLAAIDWAYNVGRKAE